MASNSPGNLYGSHFLSGDSGLRQQYGAYVEGAVGGGANGGSGLYVKDSGYYVCTSDGAGTCSSNTTDASADSEGVGGGAGGTLLVLEPKSLRSFTTNDEYLYAMKEDLADWFTCLYHKELTADTFLSVLETGVLLCQHANKVNDFARQRREKGEPLEMRSYFIRSVPEHTVPYREGVKPETFQARDNVSNFISWSRQMGIPNVLSFETDDLVLRKNERSVILCLLEVARVGAKLGMLAPTLVQMEEEIDAELAGEEPKPQVQIKTCDMRSLDERVRDLIGRCTCPIQFPMVKVGEGKYKIGDSRTLIFVRILRNHVMVRVGGGWDTLENYLNKHDPCQCNYRGHRSGPASQAFNHKVSVNQQRRASTPGQGATGRPAPATPTSPRRANNHARSTSPQPSRSKSPTLVISRHNPVPSKSSYANTNNNNSNNSNINNSASVQSGRTTPVNHSMGVVSQSWLNSSNGNASSQPSQPTRCKSPSPSRLRSPSPRTTAGPSSTPRPSVLRSSSSSSLLKARDGKSSVQRPGGRGFMTRSVSFDERAEYDHDEHDSLDSAPESSGTMANGGGKANVSMDKISTMTLTEFKSLLGSALTVPEEKQQTSAPLSSSLGSGDQNRQLNWDSLREKAKSVRDSISSSVTTRKAPGGVSPNGGVPGRRSLPPSPMDDRARPVTERPKTPLALRRNSNSGVSSVASSTSSTIPRPKTPTSSISRPKTPTSSSSSSGYRPKTPNSFDRDGRGGQKEEYAMARPKMPSQMKKDAVAKVAGAISNWVESRNVMDAGGSPTPCRPKTPTRPKTPVGSRAILSHNSYSMDHDEDEEENEEIAGALANPAVHSVAISVARERPSTPSRIPKPCFTPRPETPKGPDSTSSIPRAASIPRPQSATPSCQSRGASRPLAISRSGGNIANIRSPDDCTSLPSPASSCQSEDTGQRYYHTPKRATVISRKQPQASTSGSQPSGKTYKDIHVGRRAITPGPTSSRPQPVRSVTPGPRETWSSTYSGSAKHGNSATSTNPLQRRRASVTNTASRPEESQTVQNSNSVSVHRKSSSGDLDAPQMLLTNEITFSDDEEINELVKNAALKQQNQTKTETRVRSASVDARKLLRHKREEVLIVKRDGSGNHGVQVMNSNNETKYDSTNRSHVVKRPSSRGNSTDRAPASTVSRVRSQTPDPSMFKQRMSVAKQREPRSDKSVNRTEAWVDSTLSDPKRKLPPRSKRASGNEIPTSELEPRPLEEIRAVLPEPQNGLVHLNTETLDAPPEDPEMFKKMEKLFEKYREMELRASVNDIPGALPGKGGDAPPAKAASQKSINASFRSSPSVASVRTSSGSQGSSGVSSSGHGGSAGKPPVGSSAGSAADNRFRRSTSVPSSFQVQQKQTQRIKSNNGSNVHSPAEEMKSCSNGSGDGRSSNSGNIKSLKDIDSEMAKNPAVLMSKIKEILKVRPRKDDNSQLPTRIPAPASLAKSGRSKSVSNLLSQENGLSIGLSVRSREDNGVRGKNSSASPRNPLNKSNSTSSGNIAYTEFVYRTEDGPANTVPGEDVDEVSELSRTWSVQSDSSEGTNRCETPVPRLATPLTTGRSTFINRRGDRLGRGLSQEKENNLSNSQSSLSSRSVLSATEDEAEYV